MPGHHDVEDDEVRQVLAGLLEALLAARRLDDTIALVGEAAAHDGPDLRVVIDDEDPRGLAHLRSMPGTAVMSAAILGVACYVAHCEAACESNLS